MTFAIGRGVRPGDYKVRLDLVDTATGKVRDRAEVPFTAPAAGHDAGVEYAVGPNSSGGSTPVNDAANRGPSVDPANPSRPSTPGGSAAGPSEVTVPGIETARIERGDSLWKISRRTYGEGERYTLIYDANQDQIRDPNLIYPGQVLVLPNRETSGAERIEKRG
ncbi:MAG: LysM peptidoglycan-binding domain-containing protein [Parafilimonas terrae]|nr:LysM peptidoglycan-binding domain-containing protein [Parafilimonas terrae]